MSHLKIEAMDIGTNEHDFFHILVISHSAMLLIPDTKKAFEALAAVNTLQDQLM